MEHVLFLIMIVALLCVMIISLSALLTHVRIRRARRAFLDLRNTIEAHQGSPIDSMTMQRFVKGVNRIADTMSLTKVLFQNTKWLQVLGATELAPIHQRVRQ